MGTLPESNAVWCPRSSRLDIELAAIQGRCRVRCVECFGSGWVDGVASRYWCMVRCAMSMVWGFGEWVIGEWVGEWVEVGWKAQ